MAGSFGFHWPLMQNNVSRADLDTLIDYLRRDEPMLTQAEQVQAFEHEWSEWLGVRHSVFVNSGASANLVTMAALRETRGSGEVIVPPLTWVSDIASVLYCGLEPVFVDIDPRTLGMDPSQVLRRLGPRTRAVFLTHVLGYNALTQELLDELAARNIPLIEDVCESHGATFRGRKLGTWGLASNFSFYYAHHMTTGEGGMVCTDDETFYQAVRMLRSHGLVREASDEATRRTFRDRHPDLTPDFIFAIPGFNVRSTELNAVLGRSQLRRLDERIERRNQNLRTFLAHLDPTWYRTNYATEGCSNYALTLVLLKPDISLRDRVEMGLRAMRVEFRRGTSGGGNQLRQPYLRERFPGIHPEDFPVVDHVHFFGWYIGNWPDLETSQVLDLCRMLNELPGQNTGTP